MACDYGDFSVLQNFVDAAVGQVGYVYNNFKPVELINRLPAEFCKPAGLAFLWGGNAVFLNEVGAGVVVGGVPHEARHFYALGFQKAERRNIAFGKAQIFNRQDCRKFLFALRAQ